MATCCHSRTRPGPRRVTGGISSGSAGTWPATNSPWARRCWTWARGSRRSSGWRTWRFLTRPAICEHLQVEDRQSTSARSQFLDACRSRNRGELDAAQLAEVTVRLGFANVIDAFHISRGGQPTQTRFFVDERARPPGHHADRPSARAGQRPAGGGPAARGRRPLEPRPDVMGPGAGYPAGVVRNDPG